VLFVGMLSGTYSSICIATPVLADLKEREPQFKRLAEQVALRNAGGRAALRKARASVRSGGSGTAASRTASGTAVLEDDDLADDDPGSPGSSAALDSGDPAGRPGLEPDDLTDDEDAEPVTAGRRTSGTARPVPRQQPRRGSSAKRRPAGKKKRR
jgi:hypothetical protein